MTGRRITALDVRCPSCGAVPGRRCQQLGTSRTAEGPHGSRRDEAKRQDRIANPEQVDGQLPLFPRTQAGPVVFVCRRGRR